MLKKMLLVLIVGLAVTCAGIAKAEASDVYVGTSTSTALDCYVMTETISRNDDITYVTLKMIAANGNVRYSDYRFWYDSKRDVTRFSNNGGYKGIANRYATPIEWEIFKVIKNY